MPAKESPKLSPTAERPKYGNLNVVQDERGVKRCERYGDCFLLMDNSVRSRTTCCSRDSSSVKISNLGTLDACAHVLAEYTTEELRATVEVATGRRRCVGSEVISEYKEVQIHGPILLSSHISCVYVHPRHKQSPSTTQELERLAARHGFPLIWIEESTTCSSA